MTQVAERPPPAPSPADERPVYTRRRRLSDRARSERRLGWLLCAPAAIVMLAVAGYPIGYAIYLSLQRSDLRFPAAQKFVGVDNYVSVLTSSRWWTDLETTVVITVIAVSIEFVIGMALALVMHRALVGRGLVRTTILVPFDSIPTDICSFSRLDFSAAAFRNLPGL